MQSWGLEVTPLVAELNIRARNKFPNKWDTQHSPGANFLRRKMSNSLSHTRERMLEDPAKSARKRKHDQIPNNEDGNATHPVLQNHSNRQSNTSGVPPRPHATAGGLPLSPAHRIPPIPASQPSPSNSSLPNSGRPIYRRILAIYPNSSVEIARAV